MSAPRTEAREPRRRHTLAGILGLALVVGGGTIAFVPETEARFTDTEYVASGTFTAGTLLPSTITSCTVQTLEVLGLGTVFQSVTVVWTSPYPANGVRLTLTQGATSAVVPAGSITTTGPTGGVYTHRTVLNQALLTSLVANLLGSTTTLSVQSVAGTSWASSPSTRRLTIALLGLNPVCAL